MAFRFSLYHPYLTFSDLLNTTHFVEPNGKHGKELSPNTGALFRIGREAYKRLPQAESKEEFDHGLSAYFKFINELRLVYKEKKLKGMHSNGDVFEVDWSNLEDAQIVDVAWQMFTTFQSNAVAESKEIYAELFLFHALIEIDNALICIDLDSTDSVSAAIAAANALANAMAIDLGSETLQKARQDMAYRGAIAKIERDPKQAEKRFVYECWLEWQKKPDNLGRYKGKAAFARDMLSKCEHLTSQKKIEDWCREWERANPAG